MTNQKSMFNEMMAMSLVVNGNYGLTFTEEVAPEIKQKQYERYMELRRKYREEKKKSETFLGFRRIPGSYNQNWRWNEV